MNPQMSGAIINMSSVMGTFGRPRQRALLDGQGGHPRLHALACPRGGAAQHPRQCHRAGVDHHRHDGAARRVEEPDRRATRRWARIGEPDDIAWAAVYLASDEAKFMTGQVISPNGGWYMSQ